MESKGISANRYATQAGVSPATISALKKGDWEKFSERMWQKLAIACDYSTKNWHSAETANFRMIQKYCATAQAQSISLAISYAAGSGKTHGYKNYADHNPNVIYLECADHWTRNIFMEHFLREMGLNGDGLKVVEKAEVVINTLKQMDSPLVIMDESDKLKPGPFMFFIELYNKLDGYCGFLLSGAPYFKLHMEKFARRDKKGYREIYSRVGRRFIALNSISGKDVEKVCHANGIYETEHMNSIFNDCEGDLRRVKRAVEKLKMQLAKNLTAA